MRLSASLLLVLLPVSAPALGQPVLSQDPSTQLKLMSSPEYVKAADDASTNYKTCLTEHATQLAKKNKKVAPDLLIRAAKSDCEKEAAILAMWRSDATAKLIEDKVLNTLLEHR